MFRFNNRATKDNPLDDRDRFLLALSQVLREAPHLRRVDREDRRYDVGPF